MIMAKHEAITIMYSIVVFSECKSLCGGVGGLLVTNAARTYAFT